jgi:hypothetical protein
MINVGCEDGWEVDETGSDPCLVAGMSFGFLTGVLILLQFNT